MTIAVQKLLASSHKTMPWKNGGGATTEIAVHPDDAVLADFDWRISMARVERDGPFSAFPDIDRTLCILDGAGLTLHGLGNTPVHLDQTAAPFAFKADVSVDCILDSGAVTDLNVMTRRGRFRHTVRRMHGEARHDFETNGVLVIVAQGPLDVRIEGHIHHLERDDALRFDAPATCIIERCAGTTCWFLIQLTAEAA